MVPKGLDERHALHLGPPIELCDRGVTDATLGNVEDTLHAHLIDRVYDRLQVRECVLYFAAVVEPGATDHLVWNVDPDEVLLQRTALRVGAIEDRHVAPAVRSGFV